MSRTLYKNSLYMMINSAMVAFSGFLFWILAARIYTPHEIGIATTLFSAILMMSSFSTVGLNTGLLRYLPQSKTLKKRVNSSIFIVSLTSMIFASVYLLLLPLISQDLLFVRQSLFLVIAFVVFTIASGINELLESVFLALKKTLSILLKNSSFSLIKLILPFMLISYGAFGLVSSIFVSLMIGLIIGLAILYKTTSYRFAFQFSKKDISDMASYSFGTFLSNQIGNIPSFLIPILITAKISVSQTAYYFIAASIANFMFFIPKVVSQNLLVEASHNEKDLKSHVLHSTVIIFTSLLPIAMGTILFGNVILTLFGKTYSEEGFALLKLLVIAALLGSANTIFGTILSIKKEIGILIVTNAIYAVTMILCTLLFLSKGILYVGYTTIISQIFLLIVNTYILKYKKYHL